MDNQPSDKFDAEFLNTDNENDWVAIQILVETQLNFKLINLVLT